MAVAAVAEEAAAVSDVLCGRPSPLLLEAAATEAEEVGGRLFGCDDVEAAAAAAAAAVAAGVDTAELLANAIGFMAVLALKTALVDKAAEAAAAAVVVG